MSKYKVGFLVNSNANAFCKNTEVVDLVDDYSYSKAEAEEIINNGRKMTKKILDVCCGSKMFWFDKDRTDTVYMDNRELEDVLCDGRNLEIKPDIVADFRNIPFQDKTFKLVVFDPPHLLKVGEKSWLAKKYGHLGNNWKEDIKQGFKECFRVLESYGVLIFKWNEEQIKLSEILKLTDVKPLFGNKRAKTHWLVFMKEEVR